MSVAVHFLPPVTGTTWSARKISFPMKSPHTNQLVFPIYPESKTTETRWLRKSTYLVVRAIEQSRDTTGSEFESDSNPPLEETGSEDKKDEVEINAIGAEIKAAMEQRKAAEEKGKNEFLSGVAEEVREIEWPAFQKVIGTTGVVLGVIAGSSIVLLTVNFILAELSDRVFIGKGVQDFFS